MNSAALEQPRSNLLSNGKGFAEIRGVADHVNGGVNKEGRNECNRSLTERSSPDAVSRPFITVNERTSMRVDELLNELESDQNREQSWGARLTAALRNAWQLHVEQAEQTLLPEAESLLGPTKLQQLLYDMNAIRTRQSEMDSAI